MNHSNEDEIKAATLDSGVLVEYLSLDKEKPDENKFLKHLEDSLLETEEYRILYISALVKVELLYITCRLSGWKKAKKTIEEFLSNFVILRAADLDEIAAQIKCRVPIALADCYTLAIGKLLSVPTYFSSEKELTENIKEIIREELSIDLKLIEKPV
jgi:predicted nucleic acid-binding protein